jgi:hypothetical protein
VPLYEVDVFRSGQGQGKVYSNPGGLLSVGNYPAAFQDVGLQFHDPQPDLHFEYSCFYTHRVGGVGYPADVTDGSICPPGGASTAASIGAIKIALAGKGKDRYVLQYNCKEIDNGTLTDFPLVSGEWCGTPGYKNLRWLTSIHIELTSR